MSSRCVVVVVVVVLAVVHAVWTSVVVLAVVAIFKNVGHLLLCSRCRHVLNLYVIVCSRDETF